MAVDLFPAIKIPVVVVATFFNGMPPEQVETDITGRFERFFTLGSGIEHMESRSLPGVSIIKVYFQPGTDADSAVTTISNLAMADLRKLPPGTLPPVVLKMDASSLPVCLVTLKGDGLNESQLRDLGQFAVRNQMASVPGASVPQPFGGRYRQIMVYVDPVKMEAYQLSAMDVVRAVNDSNLILPAGDVTIGPYDYNIYTNSQLSGVEDINNLPLKTVNNAPVLVKDVGYAKDGSQIQYNIVRVDGQPSVYLPVLKQGGDANTIAIVDGVKKVIGDLVDVPKSLVTNVVFDQSVFVKTAIETLLHEGGIGLVLTGLMIIIFLGNFRATLAVFLSIPLSALATFIALFFGGGSDQFDDSWRTRPGLFPIDRQFGCGVGKHLPTHGTWRVRSGRGGARRDGSLPAGTGGHVHHGDCLFPGDFSLRCQPIPFHRACLGRRPVALCLLHRRHDRRTSVLRKVHIGP